MLVLIFQHICFQHFLLKKKQILIFQTPELFFVLKGDFPHYCAYAMNTYTNQVKQVRPKNGKKLERFSILFEKVQISRGNWKRLWTSMNNFRLVPI